MISNIINSKCVSLDEPKPFSEIRLFCFPYAGGGASLYSFWNESMPNNIEVCPIQLPGREERIMELAIDNIYALIENIVIELEPWLNKKFAFFGHCMGAKISFELTKALSKKKYYPQTIFVSACEAPHIPERYPIYNLSDDEIVRRLSAGTSEEVLNNRELINYLLPNLRKDFHLSDTYLSKDTTPVECSITAFCGTEDDRIDKDNVMLWEDYTNSLFRLYDIKGDHFFVKTSKEEILSHIHRELMEHSNIKNSSR